MKITIDTDDSGAQYTSGAPAAAVDSTLSVVPSTVVEPPIDAGACAEPTAAALLGASAVDSSSSGAGLSAGAAPDL